MRRYNANKNLLPLPRAVSQPLPAAPLEAWEDGRFWHDLKPGARILYDQMGAGYSYGNLLKRIHRAELIEGFHWYKDGGRYKVNLWRVIKYPAGLVAAVDRFG